MWNGGCVYATVGVEVGFFWLSQVLFCVVGYKIVCVSVVVFADHC